MGQRVEVARAARLLGIKRSELQNLIQRGDLVTFEGNVDLDDLRECFPGLLFEESNILERTRIIRETAFERRVLETLKPSNDSLKQQIRRLKTELSVHKNTAITYRALIEDLLELLNSIQQQNDDGDHDDISTINHWLLLRFRNINRDG